MSCTIIAVDQRSDAGRQARVGRLTASRAADVLATIKSGEAAARRDYRLQLVVERLTGQPQENGFTSADMQRGIDLEPAAFSAYEAATGILAERVGFCAHDTLLAGCSPDGVVGAFEGLVELKCPKSATHLRYLRAGVVPTEYLPQIVCSLWVTGAAWCDFVSFDDRFPIDLQLFRVRVTRSTEAIALWDTQARMFLAEVEAELASIQTLREGSAIWQCH